MALPLPVSNSVFTNKHSACDSVEHWRGTGKGPLSTCAVVRSAGRAGERPDQVPPPSRCLVIDPSGIVFSIVSIMMALVLLSTLASRHE